MTSPTDGVGFQYFSEPFDIASQKHNQKKLTVRIPAGINSRKHLFRLLREQLNFPDYFGENWDALQDCLTDFHWLTGVNSIRIVHEGLPFYPGWKKRRIYLDILKTVLLSWRGEMDLRIEIWFPATARAEIESLLG